MLKVIRILRSCYNKKQNILKTKQNNKCVCIHDIKRLTIMKMKMKMKNKSHRYDISTHRSRQGQKYSKYKVPQYDDLYVC